MLTRIAVGLLLGVVSFPSLAQHIYKCVAKEGTTYQSEPCPKGEPTAVWPTQVAPRSAAVVENEQRLDRLRRQNAAAIAPVRPYGQPARGGGLHHISQYKDANACESAKAERARAYAAAGMSRSFELSRRMDDMVWAACK